MMILYKNIYSRLIILLLLYTLTIGIYSEEKTAKKRVCIIGAGPAGLASAKEFSKLNEFEPLVFERNSDIGGQWLYSEKTDVDNRGFPVHSGIYKYMRTNFPKQLLAYPDYQEFHGENRSYVKHDTVLDYLKNYTDYFNIRHLIQLNTLVEEVHFVDNWKIKVKNLNTQAYTEMLCEAVMVCTGNFFKPDIPEIPGMENFSGRVLHSHDYRRPEEFSNQTVAVLGASFSGIDIGIEISQFAKTIYLSHRHEKMTSKLPANVEQVPGIVAANNNQLILSNGSRIYVDSFIFCTGYLHEYPFLDSSSGIVIDGGKYVHPLYKHFINREHPTMAIIGLPHPGLPLQVSYVQAHYFAALLQDKVELPNRTQMIKESALPAGIPASKAHYMAKETLDYYKDLAQTGGAEPLLSYYEKAFSIWVKDLTENPMHFKEKNLYVYDDGRIELI